MKQFYTSLKNTSIAFQRVIATDENYEFWKQNIQEELYKIYPMLSEDYSYEYDRAKQQNEPTYKKD